MRTNIAECLQAAYTSLTVSEATPLLMFSTVAETTAFVTENYPHWRISAAGAIEFSEQEAVSRADAIPAQKVIREVLAYASELERIV